MSISLQPESSQWILETKADWHDANHHRLLGEYPFSMILVLRFLEKKCYAKIYGSVFYRASLTITTAKH